VGLVAKEDEDDYEPIYQPFRQFIEPPVPNKRLLQMRLPVLGFTPLSKLTRKA
jgi:hypothetical protein